MRNAKNPICQVTKRLIEQERAGSHPKETDKKSWQFVAENERNGCFLLHNEEFAFVKEKRDGSLLCDIISQNSLESFYTVPCDSKLINVVFVRNLDRERKHRRLLDMSDIERKVACLPYRSGYVLMPLLHRFERKV